MANVLEQVAETLPPELIVHDVAGVSAMSHDSKETISLGDLVDDDLDSESAESAGR